MSNEKVLTVIGPNLPNNLSQGYTFHVHAQGCRDIARYGPQDLWTESIATQTELCDNVYPPEGFDCESGDYIGEFKFFPCCGAIPIK